MFKYIFHYKEENDNYLLFEDWFYADNIKEAIENFEKKYQNTEIVFIMKFDN